LHPPKKPKNLKVHSFIFKMQENHS
jgi:hypothetical protein